MGYDVTVRFKNSQERENMKNFLDQNKDILARLENIKTVHSPYHSQDVCYGEDLGYAPKFKNMLGFHGTGIPEYMWNLCAWMTVKSSYRDKNNKLYFYYDSKRMVVTFDIENKQNTIVDRDGIPVIKKVDELELSKRAYQLLGLDPEKSSKEMQELFIKLNNNWNEYNNQLVLESSSVFKMKKTK